MGFFRARVARKTCAPVRGFGNERKLVATNATMFVLKDCAHWVMEEKPKETTDASLKFLGEMRVRPNCFMEFGF